MLFAEPKIVRPMQQKLDLDQVVPAQEAMMILPAMEPAKLFCDQRIALFDERMLEATRER